MLHCYYQLTAGIPAVFRQYSDSSRNYSGCWLAGIWTSAGFLPELVPVFLVFSHLLLHSSSRRYKTKNLSRIHVSNPKTSIRKIAITTNSRPQKLWLILQWRKLLYLSFSSQNGKIKCVSICDTNIKYLMTTSKYNSITY
jgi:hypothetical protein